MPHSAAEPPTGIGYEDDLVLWSIEQARLLRGGHLGQADMRHLVEEIEGIGQSQRDAIESRLIVLLTHLVLWKYQPGARSGLWLGTIREQRRRLERLLDRSPSLRGYPTEVFGGAYDSARLRASEESGTNLDLFPASAPFTLAEALASTFLPKEPSLEAGLRDLQD